MIIRDDGAWVKVNDRFINLNYVDYIEIVSARWESTSDGHEINAGGAVKLHIGNESHIADYDTHMGSAKSEANILEDYMNEGKENIVHIGNCIWITSMYHDLININQVEKAHFTCFDADGNSSIIKLEIGGRPRILNRETVSAFRRYFNLPEEILRTNFAWPPSSLKRFVIDGEEQKWNRTMSELMGNQISIANVSFDEASLLKASFDWSLNAKKLQELLIEVIARGVPSPEATLCAEMCYNKSSLFVNRIEELHGMEETQKGISEVLIKMSAEHKMVVCIEGICLKERTPILLKRIFDYNKKV